MKIVKNILGKIELIISGLMAIAVIGGAVAAPFVRYFAGRDVAGEATEVITTALPHFVLALGLIGGSLGLGRNETIRIDLLQRFYPAAARAILDRILFLIAFLAIGVFVLLGYKYAETATEAWLPYLHMPILIILSLRLLVLTISPPATEEPSH